MREFMEPCPEARECPFCGGLPVWGSGFATILICADCDATGPNVSTEPEAITAWNTRAGEKV